MVVVAVGVGDAGAVGVGDAGAVVVVAFWTVGAGAVVAVAFVVVAVGIVGVRTAVDEVDFFGAQSVSSATPIVRTAFCVGQSHFLGGAGLHSGTRPLISKSSKAKSNPCSSLSWSVQGFGSPFMMSAVILSISALVSVLVCLTREFRALSATPPEVILVEQPHAGLVTGAELVVVPFGVNVEVKLMFFVSPLPSVKCTGLPVWPCSERLARST